MHAWVMRQWRSLVFLFFNDTATTEIYTLSLHDALPISRSFSAETRPATSHRPSELPLSGGAGISCEGCRPSISPADRKSTRLNSSHSQISYAVFCLKKNTTQTLIIFLLLTMVALLPLWL